jgi:hypothetical protein
MPINNYANLKEAIHRRSKRDDVTDSMLDEYIDQAESEAYYNVESPLRFRSMESRQTISASTSSRFLPLPTNYVAMRALHIIGSNINEDIIYRTPEQIEVINSAGKPRFFTVTTQLEFDRVPDDDYTIEMQLYAKIAALSSSNTTNDLLTEAPNVYLFGCLWALFDEFQEFDLSNMYYQRFIGALKGVNKTYRRGRHAIGARIRIEGATP